MSIDVYLFDASSRRLVAASSTRASGVPDVRFGDLELVDQLLDAEAIALLQRVFDGDLSSARREMPTPPSGQSGPVSAEFFRLHGARGPQVLISIRDASQSDAASRDALTGLPDRRALSGHMRHWQSTAGGGAASFALLFLDLDGFKRVNDENGHDVGDKILQELASRWQSCLREGDLVARYGGDEFLVLLSGITTNEDAEQICGRLEEATRRPISIRGVDYSVNVTIGRSRSAGLGAKLEDLIAEADRDMYLQKQSKMRDRASRRQRVVRIRRPSSRPSN